MRLIIIGVFLYMANEARQLDNFLAFMLLMLAILFTLEGFGIGV